MPFQDRADLRPDGNGAFVLLSSARLHWGEPFHHEKSDTWYATVKRADGYYQRRWRLGNAGQEIHAQELRIDYVMGSGNHVRTYLHRTQRGALIELPLAWYTENGGTWSMNRVPGHTHRQ